MVDPVDLLFGEGLLETGIELLGGFEIVAERFFDNDAGPVVVFFGGEPGGAELIDNGREEARRDSEIEELIAEGIVRLVDFLDLLLEALIEVLVGEIALDVLDALAQPLPHFQVDGVRRELRHFLTEIVAKGFRGQVIYGDTDDGKLLGEDFLLGQIEKCGNEFALGEIPGSSENHHDAGLSGGSDFVVIVAHGDFPLEPAMPGRFSARQPSFRRGPQTGNASRKAISPRSHLHRGM